MKMKQLSLFADVIENKDIKLEGILREIIIILENEKKHREKAWRKFEEYKLQLLSNNKISVKNITELVRFAKAIREIEDSHRTHLEYEIFNILKYLASCLLNGIDKKHFPSPFLKAHFHKSNGAGNEPVSLEITAGPGLAASNLTDLSQPPGSPPPVKHFSEAKTRKSLFIIFEMLDFARELVDNHVESDPSSSGLKALALELFLEIFFYVQCPHLLAPVLKALHSKCNSEVLDTLDVLDDYYHFKGGEAGKKNIIRELHKLEANTGDIRIAHRISHLLPVFVEKWECD
ncbi:MAG: hypothetical protein GY757_51965 [bacterium]|nr:hypothetical protein [bacterium]